MNDMQLHLSELRGQLIAVDHPAADYLRSLVQIDDPQPWDDYGLKLSNKLGNQLSDRQAQLRRQWIAALPEEELWALRDSLELCVLTDSRSGTWRAVYAATRVAELASNIDHPFFARVQMELAWKDREERDRRTYVPPGCPYKTLRAAYADGWHDLDVGEYGGERLEIKGHMLARGAECGHSKTEWKKRGRLVKNDATPIAIRPYRWGDYPVYREEDTVPIR